MPTTSQYVLLCSASGMNTTKIKYLMSQVERESFQHGIAELVRASITRRMPTQKLQRVRSSPDLDRNLSTKETLESTVEFQLHPPSPLQLHLPSICAPTQSQQHVKIRAAVCVLKLRFWGAVFIKCFFLYLMAKNRWPRSRLCRVRETQGEIGSLSSRKSRLFYYIK